MYNTFIYNPILTTLTWLYKLFGNNLGLAIIVLTLLVRTVLIPFTLPQMKSAKKMAALKPELDALKKKHGSDNKLLQQKTLELYQKNQINPAAGCLPFVAQFVVLIALYQVFMHTLGGNGMGEISSTFLWLDLKTKDPTHVLPILAGVLQLIMSLALLPAIENEPAQREGTKEQKEDVAEMAASMQQQMVFMMPIMTVIFSLQFPSGLALYWVVTTAFSLVQQLLVSGPGGLVLYISKLRKLFIKN